MNWTKPEFVSPGSAADALVKLASVFPWIGESEVALEMAGFSRAEVTRLLADKRRAQGGVRLDALVAAGRAQAPAVTGAVADGQPE